MTFISLFRDKLNTRQSSIIRIFHLAFHLENWISRIGFDCFRIVNEGEISRGEGGVIYRPLSKLSGSGGIDLAMNGFGSGILAADIPFIRKRYHAQTQVNGPGYCRLWLITRRGTTYLVLFFFSRSTALSASGEVTFCSPVTSLPFSGFFPIQLDTWFVRPENIFATCVNERAPGICNSLLSLSDSYPSLGRTDDVGSLEVLGGIERGCHRSEDLAKPEWRRIRRYLVRPRDSATTNCVSRTCTPRSSHGAPSARQPSDGGDGGAGWPCAAAPRTELAVHRFARRAPPRFFRGCKLHFTWANNVRG